MNDFERMVESLCEARVRPLDTEEFVRQIVNWVERYTPLVYRLAPVTAGSGIFRTNINKAGTVSLWFDDESYDLVPVMTREANKRGWFVMKLLDRPAKGLTFFPNYDEKISRRDLPRYLYRVVPSQYDTAVEQYGLKPSDTYNTDISRGSKEPVPHRLYLFVDEDSAYDLVHTTTTGKGDGQDYSVWRIDVQSIGRGVNFYIDTEYGKHYLVAVWTPSHIPADAVTQVDKI